MNETHLLKIASETQIQPRQILATARLFEEGATVPFIARYRKEATGNLDEETGNIVMELIFRITKENNKKPLVVQKLGDRLRQLRLNLVHLSSVHAARAIDDVAHR